MTRESHLEKANELTKEGYELLLKGDNFKAAGKLSNAAELVYHHFRSVRREPDRSKLLFKAGSLWYEAGDYTRCVEMLSSVHNRHLLPDEQSEAKELLLRAQSRCVDAWSHGSQAELHLLVDGEKWNRLLDFLADYPYVAPPKEVALLRAKACRGLGKEDLAREFEEDSKYLSTSCY
jgi:hypothetical protein